MDNPKKISKKRSRASKKVTQFVKHNFNGSAKALPKQRLYETLNGSSVPVDLVAPIVEGMRIMATPKIHDGSQVKTNLDKHRNFFESTQDAFGKAGLVVFDNSMSVDELRPPAHQPLFPNEGGVKSIPPLFTHWDTIEGAPDTLWSDHLARLLMDSARKPNATLPSVDVPKEIYENWKVAFRQVPKLYDESVNAKAYCERAFNILHAFSNQPSLIALEKNPEMKAALSQLIANVPQNYLTVFTLFEPQSHGSSLNVNEVARYFQERKFNSLSFIDEKKRSSLLDQTLMYLRSAGYADNGGLSIDDCISYYLKHGKSGSAIGNQALRMCLSHGKHSMQDLAAHMYDTYGSRMGLDTFLDPSKRTEFNDSYLRVILKRNFNAAVENTKSGLSKSVDSVKEKIGLKEKKDSFTELPTRKNGDEL